jgi:hypothetical protein
MGRGLGAVVWRLGTRLAEASTAVGPISPGLTTREDALRREIAAWEQERNAKHVTVDWQFTTADARIKLKRLYPCFQE